jgi:hypothetical protein
MSTRATYQINGTTFYIHYDGYEAGAAGYFLNMHRCATGRGGLAERFLRGNELAEITASHEAHGDTEWRYTLIGTQLTVRKRTGGWPVVWSGHWAIFANEKLAGSKGFEPLCIVGQSVLTHYELQQALAAKIAHLAEYAAKFPDAIGNIASLHGDVDRILKQLSAVFEDSKK